MKNEILHKYKYIYHRGYYDNKEIPENSLLAFEKAIKLNMPIEFDLRLLKDKSIKHCFLYDENRYYKKDEYYIVDNKFYYIKYDYVNYNYIVEDKKNKKMYIIKNNNKDIINDNNSNQKYIPKPMYKFIYINFYII